MSKSKKENLTVSVLFNSSKPNEVCPTVALYSLNSKGEPNEKIAVAEGGKLNIPMYLQEAKADIAFGPDAKDAATIDSSTLLKFSASQILPKLQRQPLFEIPQLEWRRWLTFRTCVSGKVQKCFFYFPFPRPLVPQPVFPKISIGNSSVVNFPTTRLQDSLTRLTPPVITKCLPLCHGIVEVYKRTVCCDVWTLIPRIPELIPEIPELIPIPDPIGPVIRVPRNIRLAKSKTEPARQTFMAEETINDLKSLIAIKSDEKKFEFISERPYLIHVLCRNRKVTKVKLGETNIGLDGKFSFCYNQPFILLSPLKRCYTTYFYKVKQWIGGGYQYVYDGEASNAYFSSAQEALLSTYNSLAETCNDYTPPTTGKGKRYVMLQNIGDTPTYNLKSPLQISDAEINRALGVNGGLIDFGTTTNCPLGAQLQLLLYIDPDMHSTGVTHYRFKLVETDNNGNAIGTEQILTNKMAWTRIVNGSFPAKFEAVALGPKLIGGEEGLYQIPYVNSANRWLGNQFHYILDTTKFPDGNYNLMLELFDSAGNQMKPNGAVGAGNETDFHFLKWKDADDSDVVNYSTLIHNIRINNTSCFADIVDLRKGGNANAQDCQFMEGQADTTFSAGFRAFHKDGFMRSYVLDYRKGLNGSDVVFDSDTINKPATLNAGNPAESSTVTFSEMLDESSKCTFSLDLHVYAKHTNGKSFISAYNDRDEASFALEIITP